MSPPSFGGRPVTDRNRGSETQPAALGRQAAFENRLIQQDIRDHRTVQHVFHFSERALGERFRRDLDDLHVRRLHHDSHAERARCDDDVFLIRRLRPRAASARGHLVKHARYHQREHQADAQNG
jgi:hypothetical protein